MTASDIKIVLDREPFLTARGLQCYARMTDDRAERFREAREELERDVDGCTRAALWLADMKPTVKVGHRSSYGLKHRAERATGAYLSNGAFLVAALHLGFRYCQVPGESINVAFNISERSLKNAPTRIRTTPDGTVIVIRPLKGARQ